jgi:hypothetical protein
MIERMIRAAKLRVDLFEEVEHDTTATKQALLVVIISSLAAGIGGLGAIGVLGLVAATAISVIGWGIFSGLAYLIGVSILKTPHTEATWGQLLRAIGFAYTPGILRVFAFIPFIGPIIALAGIVLVLIAAVIAVRTALDYTSTPRAVAVAALAWIGWVIAQALVLLPFIR